MILRFSNSVLGYKRRSVLHSANSQAGRSRISSFQHGNQFSFCVTAYKWYYNFVDASKYSCCNAAYGCCWSKLYQRLFFASCACRNLLLTTIPLLIISLLVLVIGTIVKMGNVTNAALSTISVVLCFFFFVMGFGPIPNILCTEIFPTRVRGICIALCFLISWICNIIVTYSLPVLLKSIGLAGLFGMYAVVCAVSWVFIFVKVPETKGMPLEVIMDVFSVGAKRTS
ncbi:monosaccharide-sensing protein 2-like [Gossypium australe]|uniref:Monosaccharide-sensing protein 2-like n=1 Tax=Gossypium australe TaxID=47621 RepID=A0A5B6VFU9_9ROSI|nr:monosaccharide-sensing protein 2-like [Gossypium australe]